VLNEHYGQAVTEDQILAAMDTGGLMASFEDMRYALAQFGFLAAGFAVSYDQLTKLKMPVIVYLKHRKTEHFSVLRGIDESTVWLADPSLGNRTYSRWQFLDMWDTREGNTELKGLVLGVQPLNTSTVPTHLPDFFTKTPKRQTALAVKRLRALPDGIQASCASHGEGCRGFPWAVGPSLLGVLREDGLERLLADQRPRADCRHGAQRRG